MKGPANRLAALQELAELLKRKQSLQGLLTVLADLACDIVQADHGSVRLFNQDHSEVIAHARSGEGLFNRPVPFKSGEGVLGWVLVNAEPVMINDTSRDARFVSRVEQGFEALSIIAVPIHRCDGVAGVLSVTSNRVDAFSHADFGVLEVIGLMAAHPLKLAEEDADLDAEPEPLTPRSAANLPPAKDGLS